MAEVKQRDDDRKEYTKMTLGKKIFNLRTAAHISQETLAEKLEVSRQSVSKWEVDQACLLYTSASAVGGVVGNVDGNTTVESCVNKGTVSGTTGYIGGVTGQHWRAGTVINCYNAGAVSGPATVGGVSGGHKAASPTLKSCLNTGIVTDTAAAQNNIGAVIDRKSTRLNSSHITRSRMPSSA